MKVAIKIYEMIDPNGDVLHDVVVNNRYVIPFVSMEVNEVVEAMRLDVTGYSSVSVGDPSCFEHKLTNLVWHGDIEVA